MCRGGWRSVDCGLLLAPSCSGLTVQLYLESSSEDQSTLPAFFFPFSHLPSLFEDAIGSSQAESSKLGGGGSGASLRVDI